MNIALFLAGGVAFGLLMQGIWRLSKLIAFGLQRRTVYRAEIRVVYSSDVEGALIDERVVWTTSLDVEEIQRHLPLPGSRWGDGTVKRVTIVGGL